MAPPDQLVDGDQGFTQVNARLHPAQLPTGVIAEAINATLELGDIRPRWGAISGVWGDVNLFSATPLAICRWWEPATSEEALVVLTGAARSDGGMGRAWKLTSSTPPVEIPLNGLDVWTTCRLVPQRQALLLCRQGNTRHYFKSSDINTGTDVITLHTSTPDLVNGDRVRFVVVNENDTVPLPLLDNTNYYASVSGASVSLYSDSGLTTLINLTTAGSGTFYLERTTVAAGPGGLGALPLLLEAGYSGGATQTAWERGFRSVPRAVSATLTNGSALIEALNHRLDAGAACVLSASVGVSFVAGTIYYAEPADDHHLYLHASSTTALLGSSASRKVADAASSNTIAPESYSGMPMPPVREGLGYKNRFVGVNGVANVVASDPNDFLHCTPYEAALTANIGNGDRITAPVPMGDDALLLPTATNVPAITGLSNNDPTTWQLILIPGALGSIAPLSQVTIGADAWWLSRSGVASVQQTLAGQLQGVAVPVSQALARKFNEIDWTYASQACAAIFNNRYFVAVPLKGQEGTPINDCIFVFNFLTQGWEGWWQGDQINPVQFAIHRVGGQERLCWLDAAGSVRYFDEDALEDTLLTYAGGSFTNVTTAISYSATTRAYLHGNVLNKLFTRVYLTLDTWNADWSLTAITEGVKETVVYRSSETKDRTKFLTHDTANFDASTEPERAALPYREDYSVVTPAPVNMVSGTYGGLLTTCTVDGFVIGETYEIVSLGNGSTVQNYHGLVAPTFVKEQYTSGTFVATQTTYYVAGTFGMAGTDCTANIIRAGSDAILLPDAGLETELHQAYSEAINLNERDRSIQFRLDNTSGSVRWRSIAVIAQPDEIP